MIFKVIPLIQKHQWPFIVYLIKIKNIILYTTKLQTKNYRYNVFVLVYLYLVALSVIFYLYQYQIYRNNESFRSLLSLLVPDAPVPRVHLGYPWHVTEYSIENIESAPVSRVPAPSSRGDTPPLHCMLGNWVITYGSISPDTGQRRYTRITFDWQGFDLQLWKQIFWWCW